MTWAWVWAWTNVHSSVHRFWDASSLVVAKCIAQPCSRIPFNLQQRKMSFQPPCLVSRVRRSTSHLWLLFCLSQCDFCGGNGNWVTVSLKFWHENLARRALSLKFEFEGCWWWPLQWSSCSSVAFCCYGCAGRRSRIQDQAISFTLWIRLFWPRCSPVGVVFAAEAGVGVGSDLAFGATTLFNYSVTAFSYWNVACSFPVCGCSMCCE